MPKFFVSYSRRDFHAAEALTAVLRRNGVAAWLDVEQLRPGTDWEIAINDAIDRSDAVVVVGSPAAMASRWVTGEWRRALSQGKPVHVALVHKTVLPAELTSVHDLRGRFFTEARRLAAGAAPRPARRFPLSPQMGLLWLALAFCTVVAGVGAELGWDLSRHYRPARVGLAVALANVVVVAGLIHLAVRLFRRSVSPPALREGFAAALLVALFSLVGNEMWWLYLASAVVALTGNLLVRFSRTVHLEMPAGAGDDHIRGRLRGRRVSRRGFARLWAAYRPELAGLKAATAGVGSAATYWVWCHPGDLPVANLIAGTCDLAGFAKDETDPAWAFVVVTTRTPPEILRGARELFGDRAVFVLATSLRVEDDELRRHQWLDFRDQAPEGLYEFLRTVVSGPGERGVVTVPVGADRFRAPRYIANYLVFGRVLLGFAAAPPLGMLLAGDFAVPLVLVTVLLGAAVVNLMRRTADRSITAGGWAIRSVVVFLLFLAWLVLAPAVPHIPPVNRVVLFLVVVANLFGSTKVLHAIWLPPEHGQKVVLASKPVTPPLYAFALPLMSLVLATGYFLLTG